MQYLSKYKVVLQPDNLDTLIDRNYIVIKFKMLKVLPVDRCKEIRTWCEDCCLGDYVTPHPYYYGTLYHYTFLFELKRDAMLFKLRWI